MYNQIRFDIKTGNDDLRGNSTAEAHLFMANGVKIQDISLKDGKQGSWENYSTHSVTETLKTLVTATTIGRVNISMESHNGMGQSDDNWNVQVVTVTLLGAGGAQKEIMHFYGDPFHRISHSDSSFNIPEEPVGPPGTYNTVDFTIKTGSDDLRGDSSVHVLFKSPNGNVVDEGELHPKDSAHWDNNSQNEVQLSLKTPRTPCQLAHVWLTLTSHKSMTETDDNWNVESINIMASNNGVESVELGGGQGDPLQRLTGSLPTLVVEGRDCMANSIPSEPATGPLKGWVDLHTHPLSNLGFGGKLIYGGPDIGSLLPADPDCHKRVRAVSMQEALGHDGSVHGSFGVGVGIPVAGMPGNVGVSNACGDALRELIVHQTQSQLKAADPSSDARGAPDFAEWPVWNDVLHQRMWVDWIHRAYLGGLRVMVALAVNNKTLGDMTAGPDDYATDDMSTADWQIEETKAFVGRHKDFMEVAYSSADLDRIIRENKLAVVLGVEIDNIGNFTHVKPLTNPAIAREINRLYDNGVRYVFPIHLIDNAFGGTAVYQPLFNYSTYREAGHWWAFNCDSSVTWNFSSYNSIAPGNDKSPGAITGIASAGFVAGAPGAAAAAGIGSALTSANLTSLLFDTGTVAKLHTVFNPPKYNNCPANQGMVNRLGLYPQGQFAIREMMRHGMLIDIDHMSDLSQKMTIELATYTPPGGQPLNYPLNSGHSQERIGGGTERNMLPAHYQAIGALHGMAGLGTSNLTADQFVVEYNQIISAVQVGFPGGGAPGAPVPAGAFGTDTDGMEPGMPPIGIPFDKQANGLRNRTSSAVVYDENFPRSSSGTRFWDYNDQSNNGKYGGVAHYGMLYDFLKDVYKIGKPTGKGMTMSGQQVQDNLLQGADYFLKTWQICEQLRTKVQAN
jgi:microsomal dipeptidase-like Zn-dependent dipeptidase